MSAGYTLLNSSVPIHLGNLFDNQAPLPCTFSVWVSWDSFNLWSSCSKGCFGRGKFPSSSSVRFLVLTDVVKSYDAKIRLNFFYLIDMLLNIQLKISYCRSQYQLRISYSLSKILKLCTMLRTRFEQLWWNQNLSNDHTCNS